MALSLALPRGGPQNSVGAALPPVGRRTPVFRLKIARISSSRPRQAQNGAERGRESDAGAVMHKKKLGVDPFDGEESDPAKSNAMRKFLPPDIDAHIG